MNHVDLFSGIGGFALAARNVWGDEYHNVCFCDNNIFCQQVIKKNFGKDSVIYRDIRQLTADTIRKRTIRQRKDGAYEENGKAVQSERIQATQGADVTGNGGVGIRIDLLTGGFPCQPFSSAGKRRGTTDDRFLWPEMLRVITEFKPTWIIGENVAGILSMAEFKSVAEVGSQTDLFGNTTHQRSETGCGILYRIIGELEQIGYSVQPFVIPACAVNAPHRRDRVWIVANRNDGGCGRGVPERQGGDDKQQVHTEEKEQTRDDLRSKARRCDRIITPRTSDDGFSRRSCNSKRNGGGKSNGEGIRERLLNKAEPGGGDATKPATNDTVGNEHRTQRRQVQEEDSVPQEHRQGIRSGRIGGADGKFPSWNQNWLEVATKFCSLDDGLPIELGEFKLSKSKHREEQLKAYGNSIVPQVAEEIMRAIKEIEG